MIKADTTQKRCFMACNKSLVKQGRCSCYLSSRENLELSKPDVEKRITIHFEDWDYTCGDGCCNTFGTKLIMNGKELEHPDSSIDDNSYVGDDIQTALLAVLKELGYEVDFI